MFKHNRKNGRRLTAAAYLSIAVLVLGATSVFAQDTISNTSGGQTAGSLPPPTPPQPGQAGQVQSDTNAAAQSTQQGEQLTPPQPPMGGNVGRTEQQVRNTHAQLGVFMVGTDGPGLRLTSITPGSAAEAAGLRVGDFLLAINGQPVEMPNDATQLIRAHQPGDAIELRIWRDGAEQTVTATLQEFRPTVVQSGAFDSPGYVEGGYFVPGPRVFRRGYYPGYYYPGDYYGYGYRRGFYPYGRYEYYGTPNFGYYDTPWGEGVRIGGFQFGWR
jgi:hypothetical protein